MKVAFLVSICALACGGAETVKAQETGSILPDARAHLSTRNVSPEDQGREVANAYAACLLTKRATSVRKALSRGSDKDIDQAVKDLIVSECLVDGELRMPPSLLRGSLYRAAYIQKFGNVAPAPGAIPAQTQPGPESDTLHLFGDCVVRTNPEASRAFVISNPATPIEKQAVSALQPAFQTCIPPASQIRFSRSSLQAVIAESAYRAATAHVVNK